MRAVLGGAVGSASLQAAYSARMRIVSGLVRISGRLVVDGGDRPSGARSIDGNGT